MVRHGVRADEHQCVPGIGLGGPGGGDAIDEIAGNQGTINRRILGRWIERHAGQILGGLKIVRAGNAHNGVALWAIVQMGDQPGENPAKPVKPPRF